MPGPWRKRPDSTSQPVCESQRREKENWSDVLNVESDSERAHGRSSREVRRDKKRKRDRPDILYEDEEQDHRPTKRRKEHKGRQGRGEASDVGGRLRKQPNKATSSRTTSEAHLCTQPSTSSSSPAVAAADTSDSICRKKKRQIDGTEHQSVISNKASASSDPEPAQAGAVAMNLRPTVAPQIHVELLHRTLPPPKRSKIRCASAPADKEKRVSYHGNVHDNKSVVGKEVVITSYCSFKKDLWNESPFLPTVHCDTCLKRVEKKGGRVVGEPNRPLCAQTAFVCAQCNAMLHGPGTWWMDG
eukprot:TRINITY_DN18734_c0_g1_i1.p1 TRINITY_DN18734_c0_g1~~TRINITY_DN18734_c0_g1_i1.p1  ORF type:complete len:321 (-),score=9.28 TRINITY_DN18734_c0_g1_i1:1279-2181(-)